MEELTHGEYDAKRKAQRDEQDIQANKGFAILSYISVFCLISVLAAPKGSRYARFHANQGLALFIVELIGSAALSIASSIFGIGIVQGFVVIFTGMMTGGMGFAIGVISCVFGGLMLILSIVGIVNAAMGECRPLPVTGGMRILK
jgi:uncharacterized membrane protein